MKIVTHAEREAANARLHAEAERLRSQMTPEQLARLHGLPHQGKRERERRLKQMKMHQIQCRGCGRTPPPDCPQYVSHASMAGYVCADCQKQRNP